MDKFEQTNELILQICEFPKLQFLQIKAKNGSRL